MNQPPFDYTLEDAATIPPAIWNAIADASLDVFTGDARPLLSRRNALALRVVARLTEAGYQIIPVQHSA